MVWNKEWTNVWLLQTDESMPAAGLGCLAGQSHYHGGVGQLVGLGQNKVSKDEAGCHSVPCGTTEKAVMKQAVGWGWQCLGGCRASVGGWELIALQLCVCYLWVILLVEFHTGLCCAVEKNASNTVTVVACFCFFSTSWHFDNWYFYC